MSDDKKVDEHYELKHKGKEAEEKESCRLCKNYIIGLVAEAPADLGVDVSLKIPLVDVFGKID